MGRILMTGVSVVGLTATAFAADLTYSPPTQGSPFYQAPSTVQAHVDLYGGVVWFNGDSVSNEHAGLFGGAGRINVPFQDGWNLQMDAQSSSLLLNEGTNSFSAPTEFSGYLHLRVPAVAPSAMGPAMAAGASDSATAMTVAVKVSDTASRSIDDPPLA